MIDLDAEMPSEFDLGVPLEQALTHNVDVTENLIIVRANFPRVRAGEHVQLPHPLPIATQGLGKYLVRWTAMADELPAQISGALVIDARPFEEHGEPIRDLHAPPPTEEAEQRIAYRAAAGSVGRAERIAI